MTDNEDLPREHHFEHTTHLLRAPRSGQRPGQPNPGQPNPSQPNPGRSNPSQPNPSQPNPGRSNPSQPNQGRSNPSQPNSGRSNPGRPNRGQPNRPILGPPNQGLPNLGRPRPGQPHPGRPVEPEQPPRTRFAAKVPAHAANPAKPRLRLPDGLPTKLSIPHWRKLDPAKRKRYLRIGAAAVAAMIVLPIIAGIAVYLSITVPTPNQMRADQVTTLTAADGSPLDRIVPPGTPSRYVRISQIPTQLRNAVLAAEDRDFYRNPGFSLPAFVRAGWGNVVGHADAGGGSTITQQYVKNSMLSSQRSLSRKARELVISAKMARQWSKDDILEAYLNTIYFGRDAFGIADAAQAYFGKPVDQLTLADDAVLSALIREPSVLSLDDHRQRLQDRWNYVLDGMVKMGVLTQGDRAGTQFPDIAAAPPSAASGGPERLIRNQVVAELAAAGITGKAMGGLHVTTTIDPQAQHSALNAVNDTLSDQPQNLRAAVVSIDPHTGAVRAYYGGTSGIGFDYASAPLQTGSTFKVFALDAALQHGTATLSTQFSSAPLKVYDFTITNVGGESCGTCSIKQELKESLNTAFYRLELAMGPQGPQLIADAAHEAGIPKSIPGVPGMSLTQNGVTPNLGIVLGQYPVRPMDMASAYATFAARGTYRQPHFVQRVTDAHGKVLLDNTTRIPGSDRIPPDVADKVTKAMLPIAAYSNDHELADERPSAAKTGTTQYGDSGLNKDAWMIGFTPSLSTAVWVGSDSNGPISTQAGAEIYGAGLPADIWTKTMDGALDGTPVEQFDALESSDESYGSSESRSGSQSSSSSSPSTHSNKPSQSYNAPTQQGGQFSPAIPNFPIFPGFPAPGLPVPGRGNR